MTQIILDELVQRYGIDKNRQQIASYLIAQLGKSDTCTLPIGSSLLNQATQSIARVADTVGGRFVVIDAINNENVLEFYSKNNFIAITGTPLTSVRRMCPHVHVGTRKRWWRMLMGNSSENWV